MAKVTRQITVCLPNKTSELAKVCRVLKSEKINITALSVVDHAEVGMVRLVTDSNTNARKALKAKGYDTILSDVVVADMENEPGVLATQSGKLAKAGINISYVYGSASKDSDTAPVVICCDDPHKAADALG